MKKNLFLLLLLFIHINTKAQFDKIKTAQYNRPVLRPVMVND